MDNWVNDSELHVAVSINRKMFSLVFHLSIECIFFLDVVGLITNQCGADKIIYIIHYFGGWGTMFTFNLRTHLAHHNLFSNMLRYFPHFIILCLNHFCFNRIDEILSLCYFMTSILDNRANKSITISRWGWNATFLNVLKSPITSMEKIFFNP